MELQWIRISIGSWFDIVHQLPVLHCPQELQARRRSFPKHLCCSHICDGQQVSCKSKGPYGDHRRILCLDECLLPLEPPSLPPSESFQDEQAEIARMNVTHNFILFLACCFISAYASEQCSDHVALHGRLMEPSSYHDQSSKPLMFFLHQPRTAGRTLASCLLRRAYEMDGRSLCPRSYDMLRLDMKNVKCHLLSSHDDYSLVPMIKSKSKVDVAVMTHLRDPIDRFISSYEFAVLNAAREVSKKMPGPKQHKKQEKAAKARTARTLTSNVYPWSKLIPFFIKDMEQRRSRGLNPRTGLNRTAEIPSSWIEIDHPDGRVFYYSKQLRMSKWNLSADERDFLLPPLHPYNNPLVMSLSKFVQHPIAKDLLHNGQTAAVLGITNYSLWKDSGAFRKCLLDDSSRYLEIATKLLEKFTHVGSTGQLGTSVAVAAAILGFDLTSNEGGKKSHSLGEAYQACQAQAQATQTKRRFEYIRAAFMPDGRALTFRAADRRSRIKTEVIDEIRQANILDEQLHEKAVKILESNLRKFSSEIRQLPPSVAVGKLNKNLQVFNSNGQPIPLPK